MMLVDSILDATVNLLLYHGEKLNELKETKIVL